MGIVDEIQNSSGKLKNNSNFKGIKNKRHAKFCAKKFMIQSKQGCCMGYQNELGLHDGHNTITHA